MTRAVFVVEVHDHGSAAGVYRYEAYLCLPDIDGVQVKATAASPWLAVRAAAEQAGRQERPLRWVEVTEGGGA